MNQNSLTFFCVFFSSNINEKLKFLCKKLALIQKLNQNIFSPYDFLEKEKICLSFSSDFSNARALIVKNDASNSVLGKVFDKNLS